MSTTNNRTRYQRLIEAAQAGRGLWIAQAPDRALILPNEGGELQILVWPSEEAAREVLAARPDLSDFSPVHRTLEHWLEQSTPNLTEDGILVAAHPDQQLQCLRVPAADFARDLQAPAFVLQGTDLARRRRALETKRRREGGVA